MIRTKNSEAGDPVWELAHLPGFTVPVAGVWAAAS